MTIPFAPNSQTRQQLEELDMLLQRMLSLPLSPTEETEVVRPLPPTAKIPVPLPPSPPVLVREVPPAKMPTPGQPQVQAWRAELPNPNQQANINPVFSTWSTSFNNNMQAGAPPEPRAEVAPPAPNKPPTLVYGPSGPDPIVQPPPLPQPASIPIAAQQPIVVSRPEPIISEPPLSPIWWPFLILNSIFDLSTQILGPLTSWLSAPAAKHVLGWLGIMMMILSVGLGISLWLGFDWGTQFVGKSGAGVP